MINSNINSNIDPKNKYVIFCDLDATIIDVTPDKNQEKKSNLLSESAKSALSETPNLGCLENVVIQKIDPNVPNDYEWVVDKVQVLARKEFQSIFEQINNINKQAGEKVITVNIITNATYSQDNIVKLLKTFFGQDMEIDDFANRSRALPGKGEYMNDIYEKKYKKMGIPKENIYLLDDSVDNCFDAAINEFSCIPMCTTPQNRIPGTNFTNSRNAIFKTLNEIIKKASSGLKK